MKHVTIIIATLVVVLLVPAPAFSQLTLKPGAGVTYTEFSKEPATGKYNGKVGYQVGGTVVLGGQTYLEGGAFYGRKGVEFQDASTNVTFDNNIDGFRIPVMVGFNLMPSADPAPSLGIRVFGGGSAFFVTSVSSEGPSKDDLTSPTYGVFAGAGLDISMFYVDAKYEWSVSDVSKVSTADIGKSRSLFATVGIRLGM